MSPSTRWLWDILKLAFCVFSLGLESCESGFELFYFVFEGLFGGCHDGRLARSPEIVQKIPSGANLLDSPEECLGFRSSWL